jgi:hypothetical protein
MDDGRVYANKPQSINGQDNKAKKQAGQGSSGQCTRSGTKKKTQTNRVKNIKKSK